MPPSPGSVLRACPVVLPLFRTVMESDSPVPTPYLVAAPFTRLEPLHPAVVALSSQTLAGREQRDREEGVNGDKRFA